MGTSYSHDSIPMAKAITEQETGKKEELPPTNIHLKWKYGMTIMYFNRDICHWSIGVIAGVYKNNVYIVDKYTRKYSIYHRKDSALRMDNRIYPYERYVIDNGKMTFRLITVVKLKKIKMYNGYYLNEEKKINNFSNNDDIFDQKFKIMNRDSLQPINITFGKKIIFCMLRMTSETKYKEYYHIGYIAGFDPLNVHLLIKYSNMPYFAIVPKKYLQFILDCEDNPSIEMFSTVIHKPTGNLNFIVGMYDDNYVLSEDGVVTKDKISLVDFTHEEAEPYLNGEETCEKLEF